MAITLTLGFPGLIAASISYRIDLWQLSLSSIKWESWLFLGYVASCGLNELIPMNIQKGLGVFKHSFLGYVPLLLLLFRNKEVLHFSYSCLLFTWLVTELITMLFSVYRSVPVCFIFFIGTEAGWDLSNLKWLNKLSSFKINFLSV